FAGDELQLELFAGMSGDAGQIPHQPPGSLATAEGPGFAVCRLCGLNHYPGWKVNANLNLIGDDIAVVAKGDGISGGLANGDALWAGDFDAQSGAAIAVGQVLRRSARGNRGLSG